MVEINKLSTTITNNNIWNVIKIKKIFQYLVWIEANATYDRVLIISF